MMKSIKFFSKQLKKLYEFLKRNHNEIITISAFGAVIISFFSYNLTKNSLEEQLKYQEKSFRLRNRPLLTFDVLPTIVDANKTEISSYYNNADVKKEIIFTFKNSSDIPATNIHIAGTMDPYTENWKDDNKLAKSVAILTKDAKETISFPLNDDVIKKSQNGGFISFKLGLRYSGFPDESDGGWFESLMCIDLSPITPNLNRVDVMNYVETAYWEEPRPSDPNKVDLLHKLELY